MIMIRFSDIELCMASMATRQNLISIFDENEVFAEIYS